MVVLGLRCLTPAVGRVALSMPRRPNLFELGGGAGRMLLSQSHDPRDAGARMMAWLSQAR